MTDQIAMNVGDGDSADEVVGAGIERVGVLKLEELDKARLGMSVARDAMPANGEV